ncbi:MAG: OmpA family protein [Psychroserpens sp.]|uniref:OmpA family protein n=1 Tax=Psychroserpens sp. TaxID=2020870 RepID=UPI003C77F19D
MKSKFILLLLTLSTTFVFAQEKLADKFFSNYGYAKATELYEEVLKKGDTTQNTLLRLGDSYYNNSNSEKAAFWYKQAFDKYNKDDINPEYMYKYVQSLRSQGQYAEASEWIVEFMKATNDDTRTDDYNPNNIAKYDELKNMQRKNVVEVINLPFNSKFSDFGGIIKDNLLYFTSARNTDSKKRYAWNEEPFLDIYQVDMTKGGDLITYGTADFIASEKLNTDYHEASIAITNDGQTMYFTRDNVKGKKRLRYDDEGTTHLNLYKATLEGDQWTDVTALPFNDKGFSTGHPALSPDNKKLYFVSNREGGLGATDIYVVDIDDNGDFSTPTNLGDKVNTAGREMFPFVSKDSTLYFSSDGHINLGLLDIFKTNIIKDENAMPENLGAPYNSGYDDFAYFDDIDDNAANEGYYGYFSSNRPGGKGGDDIYGFDTRTCNGSIKGTAVNMEDDAVLANVVVQLINEVGVVLIEVETGIDGSYEFEVDCNSSYTVLGTKADFKTAQIKLTTTADKFEFDNQVLILEPLVVNDQIVINPIFFDYNKSNIRTDAQYELENIVDVLRTHPKMKIKIESHTDSRGRDAYNMKLSNRRAISTKDYILSRNIAPDRIESAVGFGESQLINKCSNGVDCTEEQHQENRRSYFYILK